MSILWMSLVLVVSAVIVLFSIPRIIKVSTLKHLFDDPSEDRKVHSCKTPNLGGIGIFTSLILTFCLFIPFQTTPYINYLIASSIILFTIGLKDDLVGLGPLVKFSAQILAAFLITYFADIRFTSLYGMFGIQEVSKPLSILISILVMLLIVNSFNLIDGIDTLASSIGVLVSGVFAFFFYQMHANSLTYISLSLAGSLLGFLWYNRSPAKIFMGDTGSLLIGFLVSVLSIKFVELNHFNIITNPAPLFPSAPSLVCGMLIIPLFDTFRVFTLRLIKGKSPFVADRNHIHHRLLDFNLTHIQSSLILVGVNIMFIALCFYLQEIGVVEVIIFITLLALTLNILSWHLATIQRERVAMEANKILTASIIENSEREIKIVPLELKLKEIRNHYEMNDHRDNSSLSYINEVPEESKQIVLP